MRRGAGFSSEKECVPIPSLPGSSVHRAQDFPRAKRQIFKFINGIPLAIDEAPPHCTSTSCAVEKTSLKTDPTPSVAERSTSSSWNTASGPSWLQFDRKVLRFYAYFKESIDENALETWRIRKCTIFFYLEDGTLQVNEPKQDNSGLYQGVFLRRHRVHGRKGFLSWKDVHIGESISLYGRSFHIHGCDDFTREFLKQQGIDPQSNEGVPSGPYEQEHDSKQARLAASIPSTPRPKGDPKKQQFLKYDGKVLRFDCCWDDSKSLFGDKLPFVLHYYLVDDTVEIRETPESATGRDPFFVFLKRMKLPKGPRTVGVRPPSAGSLLHPSIEFYNWKDFRLGHTIQVYGRRMFLMDCNGFTRAWFKEQLGLDEHELEPCKIDFDDALKPPPVSIPPNTLGIGSEEDSLQNVFSLVPQRPQKNQKWIEENGGVVLRFAARYFEAEGFKIPQPRDKGRRFIVSYFPSDETLSVFEVSSLNSGIQGGKFLERMKVPCIAATPSSRPYYLSGQDMYIGAQIKVFGRVFELLDADVFTLRHMEENKYTYSVADVKRVVSKISKTIARTRDARTEKLRKSLPVQHKETAHIGKAQLLQVLRDAGIDITLHEVVTLKRHLDPNNRGLGLADFLQFVGVEM